MKKENKLPDLCTRTIKLSDLRFKMVAKGRADISHVNALEETFCSITVRKVE